MKIYYEDFANYTPWSGAEDTYRRIVNEGKLEDFESMIEELYPEGIDETQLNDILWFDDDWVLESLGIRTETQIRNDIRGLQDDIDNLWDEYQDYIEDAETEEERGRLLEYFEKEKAEIQNEIDELEEELEYV